jgi:hypothetical protein
MSRRTGLGLVTLALALSACGSEGQNPTQSGDLFVSYFQSGPQAGAFLLTITGGTVDNVTGLGGQQVSFTSPFAGTTKVVVAGAITNGDLLRLRVSDVTKVADYTVHIEQVADNTTFALIDPSGYSFTVHR